jgi:hypothetical protein
VAVRLARISDAIFYASADRANRALAAKFRNTPARNKVEPIRLKSFASASTTWQACVDKTQLHY